MSTDLELEKFVNAQNPVYEEVCAELRKGQKRTHWIWFIFPQIEGLGSSIMAQKYALSNLTEAKAYLKHPVLGTRLRECTQIVLKIDNRTAEDIFAHDAVKFRSSMTLFAQADVDGDCFKRALLRFFDGKPDPLTLQRL